MSGQKQVIRLFCFVLISGLIFSLCPKIFAETNNPDNKNDLLDMSLEQLMNVEISSSARRSQPISRASRAVYVITAEDIRQAGPVRIDDLLRQVPGMDVFQTKSLVYNVGCRGYSKWNNERMQILLDGRPLYDPYLGGALFYLNPIFLEEIERIEVIRGSAGVTWGVNAMNGVINIITKKAADTQGGLIYGGFGSRELQQEVVRYGGTNGPVTWRVMAGSFHDNAGFWHDNSILQPDDYKASQVTGRAEWKISDDSTLTFTGGGQNATDNKEFLQYMNLLWEKKIDRDNSAHLRWTESYISRTGMWNGVDVHSREEIFEVQFNSILDTHNIVWGADYTRDVYRSSPLDPVHTTMPDSYANDQGSAFIEDEITLADNLWFTLGYRGYYNEMTHFDWAASSALIWEFTPNHFFRGSISRSFRRPTMWEEFKTDQIAWGEYGNDSLLDERMVAYEISYRGQWSKNFSVNVEGYLNKDKDKIALIPITVPSWHQQHNNVYNITTYGIETSVEWKPVDWWLIRGFHNYMHQTNRSELTYWETGETGIMLSPKHRIGLTNRFNLDKSTTLNTQLYWTDVATASYADVHGKPFWRFDVRLARRLWNDQAEIAVGANNLLDRRHYEGGYDGYTNKYNEVPQMYYVQFFYKF